MIVYLHGFNSSPASQKAQLFGRYVAEHAPGIAYACPSLPSFGNEAIGAVESLLASKRACFIGSSLGGFYATYLAERHDARAVLINPAIEPHVGLRAFLGPQQNLYTGERYELTEEHLVQWNALYVPRITPRRYLLLVETGDEVLDYRQAVKRYAGAEQLVVEGGDHSLRSFPHHMPRILEFCRATPV